MPSGVWTRLCSSRGHSRHSERGINCCRYAEVHSGYRRPADEVCAEQLWGRMRRIQTRKDLHLPPNVTVTLPQN
jgi:hypothetical protein